jgi:Rrf2 family protein
MKLIGSISSGLCLKPAIAGGELIYMMLAVNTDYSIRVLLLLAATFNGKPIDETEISKQTNIPRLHLADILNSLENAGYLRKQSGENAGYMLAKKTNEISLWDVVEVNGGVKLEAPQSPKPPAPNQCVEKLHRRLRSQIANVFGDITLEKLVTQSE